MSSFCCKMREKYLIAIVADNPTVPHPVEAVDFTDFDRKSSDGKPVLVIKFCPFCGKPVAGPKRVLGEEGVEDHGSDS